VFEATLPPELRLALAYAPAAQRPLQLAAFALDTKLAGIVGTAREVLLAQIKLAWWRERLAETPAQRPRGEPLLAALAGWSGPVDPLLALIDGWEAMLDPDEPNLLALAEGRAALGRGLAIQAGAPAAAEAAGSALHGWSLASMGQCGELAALKLPRQLRTLAVLHGLARRRRGAMPLLEGPLALAAALRIGMIGR
jgi:phytoene synthase